MTEDLETKQAEQQHRKSRSKSAVQGAWPDPETRRQMSQAEVESAERGKHAKNPDWQKKW